MKSNLFHADTNNGRTILITPFGRRPVATENELLAVENEVVALMTERLKRAPTKQELREGPKPNDDRDDIAKMRRAAFTPKVFETDHPLDAMADKLEASRKVMPDYSGMSDEQRLAAMMREIAARDRGETADAKSQQARMNALAPALKVIDDRIEAERWRSERGSQKVVDLCEMLREQVLAPNNDPAVTKSLRAEINKFLETRKALEADAIERMKATHQAAIDALEGGEAFAEIEMDEVDELTVAAEAARQRSADGQARLDAINAKLAALQNEQLGSATGDA